MTDQSADAARAAALPRTADRATFESEAGRSGDLEGRPR
jgi:hypothetical protein